MRALQRPQDHRHVVKSVMLALERQFVAGKAFEDEFEGLVIDFAGLREIEAVSPGLERRHPASAPHPQPPPAGATMAGQPRPLRSGSSGTAVPGFELRLA